MDALYGGVLKGDIEFYIRKLELEDLGYILAVQHEVARSLVDAKVLATLSEEEFQYILSGNGSLIGVFVEDKLIAFRATLVPIIDDEHLGFDIGLKYSELSSVIYQEISSVSPSYRGHGLQRLMGKVLMKKLQESNYQYVCATVAPFNIPSLKDKFSQQMEIAALKEKYGGMLRYVFVKELKGNSQTYKLEQFVLMEDTSAQQKLLAEGWRGTGIRDGQMGWLVRYEK